MEEFQCWKRVLLFSSNLIALVDLSIFFQLGWWFVGLFCGRRDLKICLTNVKLQLEYVFLVHIMDGQFRSSDRPTFNRHRAHKSPAESSKSLSLVKRAREIEIKTRSSKIAVNFFDCCRICLGMILIAAGFLAHQQLAFFLCVCVTI